MNLEELKAKALEAKRLDFEELKPFDIEPYVTELADAVLALIEHNANLMGRILDYRCAFSDEQEKLAIATEALKRIGRFEVAPGWNESYAREALVKIEEVRETAPIAKSEDEK